jgi:hypothetical protein
VSGSTGFIPQLLKDALQTEVSAKQVRHFSFFDKIFIEFRKAKFSTASENEKYFLAFLYLPLRVFAV